jgi:hypothetical protein
VNATGPISNEVTLRVVQQNLEFENPLPDVQFMADLAQTGGGAVLHDPAEARAFLERSRVAERAGLIPYSEPLWSNAWLWAALLALLTIEWTLRRFAAA